MARAGKTTAGEETIAKARIRVCAPPHLCRAQRTTRALCRSAGFSESAVFQAVIAVTDLAYRLYLERKRNVELTLSALRHEGGRELRAEDSAPGGR
ncbi:MAG: hypothetical protein PHS14_20600, partial [Elusimicrobia bacterium]|nr:hypothetical protein [Elusimicrobiota bacterium]